MGLMGLLAANEALQQALKLVQEEEEVLRLTQGSVEGTSLALVELDDGSDSDDDEVEVEVTGIGDVAESEEKEESLLDLDFFDQGKFAKETKTETANDGVETAKAPGTTPILPDL